jgi:hypothetical protein
MMICSTVESHIMISNNYLIELIEKESDHVITR